MQNQTARQNANCFYIHEWQGVPPKEIQQYSTHGKILHVSSAATPDIE